MKISIIAAMAKNKVIGKNNKLPWHLSDDLKNFKNLTKEKIIVMGRKTYESIGKPLPQRRNIVLTRNAKLKIYGCEVMSSKDQLLKELQEEKEIMVIGGSEIYQMFLPEATTIHLTLVNTEIKGDAFFPDINWEDWRELSSKEFIKNNKNEYDFKIVTFVKK